jgi:hypothetical protein
MIHNDKRVGGNRRSGQKRLEFRPNDTKKCHNNTSFLSSLPRHPPISPRSISTVKPLYNEMILTGQTSRYGGYLVTSGKYI